LDGSFDEALPHLVACHLPNAQRAMGIPHA
jgi:hypothetical protein